MLNKVCPPWVNTNPSKTHFCRENEFFDDYFNFIEYNVALSSKHVGSSPGLDGIDYEILKKLPIRYHLILLDVFNQMFQTSLFPESWRDTFVHFVDKPDGRTVRPISLTSCVCKLFETMAKNRLQWW